jgi:hypothetical protein
MWTNDHCPVLFTFLSLILELVVIVTFLAVTKYMRHQTYRRKDLLWLMVSEGLVHGFWLHDVLEQNIMVAGACVGRGHSPYDGQETARVRKRPAIRYNLQRHDPSNLLLLAPSHFLNFPELPKIEPPAGEPMGGHFMFKL